MRSVVDMFFQFIESQTIEPWLYCVRRGGYSLLDKGFRIKRTKSYPYCNLHYIEEGHMKVIYNNIEYKIQQGQIFILPSFTGHDYYVEGEYKTKAWWLEFAGADSEKMVLRLEEMSNGPVLDIGDEQRELVIQILKHCTMEGCVFDKSQLLYKLLIELISKKIEEEMRSVATLSPLDQVLQHIDQHIGSVLRVEELAFQVGYSSSYLITCFKKQFAMTPNQYIYHRRVIKAKQLLSYADLSLENIAEICGFYDASHLVHRFKKHEGLTPLRYKREIEQYTHP